jgi:enamine deaminase RidA (YjgF/YER057c/UK114 family)
MPTYIYKAIENHFHQVNAFSVELLAHNQYDELGHLISKQVGGQDTQTFNGLQQVDYTFNILETVQVAGLPKNVSVEISMIAVK